MAEYKHNDQNYNYRYNVNEKVIKKGMKDNNMQSKCKTIIIFKVLLV